MGCNFPYGETRWLIPGNINRIEILLLSSGGKKEARYLVRFPWSKNTSDITKTGYLAQMHCTRLKIPFAYFPILLEFNVPEKSSVPEIAVSRSFCEITPAYHRHESHHSRDHCTLIHGSPDSSIFVVENHDPIRERDQTSEHLSDTRSCFHKSIVVGTFYQKIRCPYDVHWRTHEENVTVDDRPWPRVDPDDRRRETAGDVPQERLEFSSQ